MVTALRTRVGPDYRAPMTLGREKGTATAPGPATPGRAPGSRDTKGAEFLWSQRRFP